MIKRDQGKKMTKKYSTFEDRNVIWFYQAAILVLLLFVVNPLWAATENYVSLYQYDKQLSYCSPIPIGDSFEENVYPCLENGAGKNYKIDEIRSGGFKDMYNPLDARVVCARPGLAEKECNGVTTMTLNLLLSSVWSPMKTEDMKSFPDAFRFYLPPGTIGASATIFTPRDTKEGIVVRYGDVPECSECIHAWDMSSYTSVPWDKLTQLSITDLINHKDKDIYLLTRGGHALVITSSSLSEPLAAGGWVYIHKLPFDGDDINEVHVSITVNRERFTKWYLHEAHFLDNGDPVSVVDEICSPDSLADCSKSSCTNAGYYWYDGQCQKDQACTSPEGCDGNKDQCEGSEYYYYSDGSCHEEMECRKGHEEGCYNEEDCRGVGGYYYNQTCNPEKACSTLSDCDRNKDLCTGSGYVYNDRDDTCHDRSECRQDHPEGCFTPEDCADINGYWYDGQCNGDRACATPSDCDNEDHCTGSGYHYLNGSCREMPACDREHPEGCNEDACSFYGYWYDGQCHGDRACAIPSDCDNKDKCEGSAYYYWSDGSCHATVEPVSSASPPTFSELFGSGVNAPSTSSPPVDETPVCDPDHLTLCTEADCESAGGGYWYDDTCNLEPAPQAHKTKDFNSQRSKAWLDLGPGAWDGEVNKGEKLELTLNFPDGGGDKTSYAAIVVNDSTYYLDNHDGMSLTPAVQSLRANTFADLKGKTLVAPVDICQDSDYQATWTVYFITFDSTVAFDDTQFEQALADPSLSYTGGAYTLKVDCSKEAAPMAVAAPSQALSANVFDPQAGVLQPEFIVTVASGPLLIQPRLTVVPEDVGKTATPFVYFYLPDLKTGQTVAGTSRILENNELSYGEMFPRALDFCGADNSDFDVYCGYTLPDGTIKYGSYKVKVE